MKKQIKLLFSAVALVFSMLLAPTVVPAWADDCPPHSGEDGGICDSDSRKLEDVIKNILSTVFFWTSIVAVIFIIIGGINYTMSQGDPGKVKKAKDTILYAIIGLIVSLSAFAIVQFVINAIAGTV